MTTVVYIVLVRNVFAKVKKTNIPIIFIKVQCYIWYARNKQLPVYLTSRIITDIHTLMNCVWYDFPLGYEFITKMNRKLYHYYDVIMGTMASQITSLTIVYSTVYSDADQRKHQSSALLAFVWEIQRGPLNSPQQLASSAENASIWWRHHDCVIYCWHYVDMDM